MSAQPRPCPFATLLRERSKYAAGCRRVGVRDVDIPDVLQHALEKVHVALQGDPSRKVDNLEAWMWTVVHNTAIDCVRRYRRRPRSSEAVTLAAELEESGVHSIRDVTAVIEAEEELAELRGRFFRHVHAYAEAASRGAPRGREQVWAWFHLRVEARRSEEVARLMGVQGLANGGRDAVWQWAKRGRDIVLRIAERDRDAARGSAMRMAALETA